MVCGPVINVSSGGSLIVSSTTRPTGTDRYTGVEIFEADTGRKLLWDGTGWVIMSEPTQTSTTSSFAGITGGTPTYANTYKREDGWINFTSTVTLGATPSAIASLAWTPPVALAGTVIDQVRAAFNDGGVTRYPGLTDALSAGNVPIYCLNSAGTNVVLQTVTLTAPFTFGISDQIIISGRAQMSTRYS